MPSILLAFTHNEACKSQHAIFKCDIMERCTAVIKFKKTAIMRYISHLDLLRVFQRAARRSRLKLSLTEGFNPHPKIKIEPAVKLGIEASDLRAEIVLDEIILPEDLNGKFKRELPGGIVITDVQVT